MRRPGALAGRNRPPRLLKPAHLRRSAGLRPREAARVEALTTCSALSPHSSLRIPRSEFPQVPLRGNIRQYPTIRGRSPIHLPRIAAYSVSLAAYSRLFPPIFRSGPKRPTTTCSNKPETLDVRLGTLDSFFRAEEKNLSVPRRSQADLCVPKRTGTPHSASTS